jgi:antitoxin component of RelBE/YafQ-DinJ toxin-antitoxin module
MRINVRVSAEDREALDAEAARLGVSVSDVVRIVVKTYLPEMKARENVLRDNQPHVEPCRPA